MRDVAARLRRRDPFAGDRSGSPSARDAGFDSGTSDAARSELDAAVRAPVGDAGRTSGSQQVIADPNDEAAYIYDQSALRSYDLRLAPADLARLDAAPGAEEYVEGALRFEDRDYAAVGVRYKGSVGAFRGCLTGGNGVANNGANTGAKSCTKLSMKLVGLFVLVEQIDGRFTRSHFTEGGEGNL
ncbi:MAG TPA: hypothetical protein VK509_05760 [Polyangiales bacterium]|nr:hypothetical protein [Polyangiales bacterium]